MSKFEFLKEPFIRWLKEKQHEINKFKKFDKKSNAKMIESLEANKINFKNLDKILIKLSEIGTPDTIQLILERFIYYYHNSWIPKEAPIISKVKYDIFYTPNALNWTLVNVHELNFFDMSDIDYEVPYNQCRFCGHPDGFDHFDGYKHFNKKLKYCHDYDCTGLFSNQYHFIEDEKGNIETLAGYSGSRPNEHLENCCYRKYAIPKKKLYQQITNILKMKYTKTSDDELIENIFEIDYNIEFEKTKKEKAAKLFIDYCNLKLKENENIQWTIQTKSKKAVFIDDWFN